MFDILLVNINFEYLSKPVPQSFSSLPTKSFRRFRDRESRVLKQQEGETHPKKV
jgi:hypothetical protein